MEISFTIEEKELDEFIAYQNKLLDFDRQLDNLSKAFIQEEAHLEHGILPKRDDEGNIVLTLIGKAIKDYQYYAGNIDDASRSAEESMRREILAHEVNLKYEIK